ncbi:MAG: hypothetical protein P1U70_06140 [Saprospiraceae bacterium]|jgi:hypothetical protein|nr:hypothetical protein [Saprospiraceae bacterium]
MENSTTNTTVTENKKPDYQISIVRDTLHGSQWAQFAVGWTNKDGKGINFTNDLLKMFGFKIVARKIEPKS